MATYNLNVKLTPTGHYFFGTETRNTDGTENYFQYSSQLPQQTMLLGMLRFLLLQTSSKDIFDKGRIQDKSKVINLIGPDSFNMNSTNFGAIKNISEIALWNNKEENLYLPLLVWKDKDGNILQKVEIDIVAQNFYRSDIVKSLVNLPDYAAKKGYDQIWITSKGKKWDITDGDLFTPDIQTGNFKNKPDKKDDDMDAYFKMQYYRLHKDISFLFNIKVDDSVIKQLIGKHFVYIGGERSQFSCEISDISNKTFIENHYDDIYDEKADERYVKVILTSDACCKENPYTKSLWAITQVKQFRCLTSSVERTEQYFNRSKDDNQKMKESEQKMKESELFNLLERGSVFYFEKDADTVDFLNNPVFSTIGYNKFYKHNK
jgi:CRISPR type III-B/RAMP module-associated protein Cmr3